ncbi:hypothetical protein RA210_U10401 [Rubrivivax sp. A210]|uniref:hypothetical protein n=1 Tax=Rubrivivax sp. A210 TaxID=2772301 RepID=UPI00198CD295|nr:hypothetical protein [Rubrivivax sp. A210]CAD5366590.1 hypothetical protein RA210_U10401 [Rubrivivax sp. A210]
MTHASNIGGNGAEIIVPLCGLTWTQLLPALIAALEDGNSEGKAVARPQLARMAAAADLAITAIGSALDAADREIESDETAQQVIAKASARPAAEPSPQDASDGVAQAEVKAPGKPIGHLAMRFCGKSLPLTVCKSQRGFYLGTWDDNEGPCSRESAEYWLKEAEAATALATGRWTQRQEP